MCTSHGTDRRTFLSRAGLITAGTALATATAATQAAAQADKPADWRPDPDSNRFTLVVMPDTQYLFDGPSIQRAPVEASLRYVLDHGRDDNIVFLAHLGDLTEHGTDTEFAAVGEAFELLDRNGVGYSVLTGNHDIPSRTDDQRGATPYLRTFGPDRMADLPTFGGATPDGYNTYHLIPAASTASGWSWRWTGGCPRRASPGPARSSPTTRSPPSSSPRTTSWASTRTRAGRSCPTTGSACGPS